MGDREILANSVLIVAEHGSMATQFTIQQLTGVLEDRVEAENWCRIMAVVEAITGGAAL